MFEIKVPIKYRPIPTSGGQEGLLKPIFLFIDKLKGPRVNRDELKDQRVYSDRLMGQRVPLSDMKGQRVS